MRKINLLICAIFFSFISAAYSENIDGWHKTKWGMNLGELQQIYNNELKPFDSSNSKLSENKFQYFLPSFKVGEYEFIVKFAFENDKLSRVLLEYDNYENCNESFNFVEDAMIKKYGIYSEKQEDDQNIGFGFYSTSGRDWVTETTSIHLSRAIMVTQRPPSKLGTVRIDYKSRKSASSELI